ncbi:MAG TPA: hydrogenase small subunit [Kofleriaceae bacterium]|nr:hydrogenase small subunit [Kofleriaceae bacterium]
MPSEPGHSLLRDLEARGISRRDLMQFCGAAAAMLGLPATAAGEIAHALEDHPKPTVVWLEFQDCTGDSEAFLRASSPTAAEVILDLISLDYHETLMAAAGHQAEAARDGVLAAKKGQYIAVVEGSIPSGAGGAYCTIAGKSAQQIADDLCKNALAVIAVGTCAAFGGLPAAAPNPTGAQSVGDAVSGIRTLINLPACPVNGENIVAVIAYFLTYGKWPATDRLHRPLFAYGKLIHDNCERRAHFDGGQYVERWGDEGHRLGYCLYKVGCKGPVTSNNCPNIGWNENTSWPVGCGHPCIGCAEPEFWDKMTPFYSHLTGVPGFGAAANIDKLGLYATAAVGTAFTGHALVQLGRRAYDKRKNAKEAREAKEAAAQVAPAAATPTDAPAAEGDADSTTSKRGTP